MAKQSKCYLCNTVLTRINYDSSQDALICTECLMPNPDNPNEKIPTRNILEPQDYVDMGLIKEK